MFKFLIGKKELLHFQQIADIHYLSLVSQIKLNLRKYHA